MNAPLPAGDPRKGFWTYEDLAAFFGLASVRRRLPEWERQNFPAPLPWSRRQRRYRPAAVIAWAERRERAEGAAPALSLVIGGRS